MPDRAGEAASRPVLILGLGNTILTDDGVGIYAARRARELLGDDDAVEVAEAELAGFALLDWLADRPGAVIIDALLGPGRAPGDIVVRDLDDFLPTARLAAGHQVDLPTAVGLGRSLGLVMPARIRVVAVQVADAHTLHEGCTPAVEQAVDAAARRAVALAWAVIARTG